MKGGRLERATKPGTAPNQAARASCWIGVPGIDELLLDGLRYGNQVMCTGDTGIGKTVLAAQFLYEGLLAGDSCVYVACDESPESMRMNMASLRVGTIATRGPIAWSSLTPTVENERQSHSLSPLRTISMSTLPARDARLSTWAREGRFV